MSKIVDGIRRTKVTFNILEKVVAAIAAMEPADRRDTTGRTLAIIRVLNQEGLLGKKRHLAAAIDFRLEALARLSHRPELRAWSLPGDVTGIIHVQPVVWKAVAVEPLLEEGDRPAFNADSFFRRLTALSKAAGRG